MAAADLLREIHRLHLHVRDLKNEIDDAPSALAAQKNRVTRAEEGLRSAQDTLKKLKVTAHDKEGALKAVFQQLAKYEKQRNEAQATKEFEALQHEIDHVKKQAATIEEEILAALSEIDERTAKLPEVEKSLAQVRAEAKQYESETQERETNLTNALERAQAELAALEEQLPVDIQPIYRRLIESYGADGMAAVQNKTCAACYSTLTAHHFRQLEGGRFLQCQTCSKALYLKP
jgi:predicted  nucleic acid-binding Zn-ribbon protein